MTQNVLWSSQGREEKAVGLGCIRQQIFKHEKKQLGLNRERASLLRPSVSKDHLDLSGRLPAETAVTLRVGSEGREGQNYTMQVLALPPSLQHLQRPSLGKAEF